MSAPQKQTLVSVPQGTGQGGRGRGRGEAGRGLQAP